MCLWACVYFNVWLNLYRVTAPLHNNDLNVMGMWAWRLSLSNLLLWASFIPNLSFSPVPAVSLLCSSSFSPQFFSRHYLKITFAGTCLSSLFSLSLFSSSNTLTHHGFLPPLWFYFSILAYRQQTDKLVCLCLSPSSLLSLTLLASSKQQRAVKLISWPEQTKPKPHSPSSICCYVSALWIGSFQAWRLEE